jgi:phytoene dehydrogenase-like protein
MILIIGAGMAGLASAIRLEEAGADWLLLEREHRPGGRVASELTSDGYILDQGFQVLLDSYTTVRKLVDIEALAPRYFQSGALLMGNEGCERILNPLKHPSWIMAAPLMRSFSFKEKLRMVLLGIIQCLKTDRSLLRCEVGDSAWHELGRWGLQGEVLEKFLRPFFAGVFLDDELGSDASILRYDLKKFALGRALVPAGGMGEIPRQMACNLPSNRLRFGASVQRILFKEDRSNAVVGVELVGGEKMSADHIILATDSAASSTLLGLPEKRSWANVSTFYFSGNHPLYEGGFLVLPEGKGNLVRHFTDLTNTVPDYAPSGKRLLSATVLSPPGSGFLPEVVQRDICRYFPDFADWVFLREITVKEALPSQAPGFHRLMKESHPAPNLWLAGDQVSHASIDSSMANGLEVAQEVLNCIR